MLFRDGLGFAIVAAVLHMADKPLMEGIAIVPGKHHRALLDLLSAQFQEDTTRSSNPFGKEEHGKAHGIS